MRVTHCLIQIIPATKVRVRRFSSADLSHHNGTCCHDTSHQLVPCAKSKGDLNAALSPTSESERCRRRDWSLRPTKVDALDFYTCSKARSHAKHLPPSMKKTCTRPCDESQTLRLRYAKQLKEPGNESKTISPRPLK